MLINIYIFLSILYMCICDNECKNNYSLLIARHWRYMRNDIKQHLQKNNNNDENIQCLHNWAHHELCSLDYIWPRYVDCERVYRQHELDIDHVYDIHDVITLWECKSNSIMASYLIFTCRELVVSNDTSEHKKIDVCSNTDIRKCKIIFDPLREYTIFLYIISGIGTVSVLICIALFIILIYFMPKRRRVMRTINY